MAAVSQQSSLDTERQNKHGEAAQLQQATQDLIILTENIYRMQDSEISQTLFLIIGFCLFLAILNLPSINVFQFAHVCGFQSFRQFSVISGVNSKL